MLTPRHGDGDFVKVLDFGLAKMQASAGTGVKTAMGVLLGTPQYMSPEACESKRALDGRTDIYALGVLLFQMMTGVLPFDGDSMGEVLVKQVTDAAAGAARPQPAHPAVGRADLAALSREDARGAVRDDGRAARCAARSGRLLAEVAADLAGARSVAPGAAGVDAKQVLAYVAAQQAAKIRPAAAAPV